jgi:hypothetical protein
LVIIITRTTHGEALIVRGTGYDDNGRAFVCGNTTSRDL